MKDLEYMIKFVKGNLITMAKNGEFDVIIHGCNIWHAMGAGIALQIKKAFPEAYEADLKTLKGDTGKIGTYSIGYVDLEEDKVLCVVNAYTQEDYGPNGDRFDYCGFEMILKRLKSQMRDCRIGMPLIGCGLAGGNKERILGIIEEIIGDLDVTIVEFG